MGTPKMKLLLPIALLALSACASSAKDIIDPVATSVDTEIEKKPPPAFQPPSNATAMQTSKSLGSVSGNLKALKTDFYSKNDFTEAIEYANKLDSYSLLIWHKGALRLEPVSYTHLTLPTILRV